MLFATSDLLALPAKLGTFATLSVALAAAVAGLLPPGDDLAPGSRQGLPQSVHDLALLEDGRYAVIRFPSQLAVGVAGIEAMPTIESLPGGVPESLAGPTTDGKVLVGDADGAIRVWEPFGSGPRWRPFGHHAGPADLLCLSPDGRWAAAASSGSAAGEPQSPVTVWDTKAGTVAARFEASGRVDCVGFAAGSEHLVTRADDGTISLWRVRDGGHVRTIRCGAAGRGSAACSPAGPLVAWCGPSGQSVRAVSVRSVSLSDGERLWERTIENKSEAGASYVPRLALSADGATVACGTADAVLLFDASNGEVLAEADASWHRVADLKFAADGSSVVSAGSDGTVRWWSLSDLSELFRVEEFLPD